MFARIPAHNGFHLTLENAYVCKYHDAKSFAHGINEMLNSPELRDRLIQGGLETAAVRSWDYINAELVAQYETVLEKVAVKKRLVG